MDFPICGAETVMSMRAVLSHMGRWYSQGRGSMSVATLGECAVAERGVAVTFKPHIQRLRWAAIAMLGETEREVRIFEGSG